MYFFRTARARAYDLVYRPYLSALDDAKRRVWSVDPSFRAGLVPRREVRQRLDVARAELASANAAGVTAGQRPNPTVALTPTYDTTTSPPWILGITFDIPIETAGKRRYRRATAAEIAFCD